MRKFLLLLALPFCAMTSYAQSSSQISAAKSMAKAYGYSDAEIDAAINRNAGKETGQAAQNVATQAAPAAPAVYELEAQPADTARLKKTAPNMPSRQTDIFGHDYFRSRGLSLIPSYNAPVPESYVLGPGDELVIDVWGAATQHVVTTIDNDGSISLYDLGPVYLSGMNVKAAENYLRGQLGRIYSGLDDQNGDTFMRLSVGKIKGVVVSVTGEVAVPGLYTIPSLSSIASVIYMAGGVTPDATVRNITLYRGGRAVSGFDLYGLIFKGTFDQNIRLQDGDIISVEPYKLTVAATGAITRPMRYELKDGESISDLIKYAAGFRTDSRRDEVNVVRRNILSGESFDVNESEYRSFPLKDGDTVNFRSNPEVLSNRVTVSGPVNHPGAYAISGGLNDLQSLINAAGGLRDGAYTGRGQIYRLDENRLPVFITFNLGDVLSGKEKVELRREDRVTIFDRQEFLEKDSIAVSGHVANPGLFRFYDGMTAADALLLAKGVRNDAYTDRGQISRLNHDGVRQIIPFNVADALSGSGNIKLMRSDTIRVYSVRELVEDADITVNGEVRKPGTNTYHEGLTLRDVIMMAGGFTNGADLSNLEVSSRGGKERGTVAIYDIEAKPELLGMMLKPYDIVSVRRLTYFKAQTAVTVSGEVKSPGTYVVDKGETRLSDIIAKVGGFTDEAYIKGAKLTRRLTEEEIERQKLAVMIANKNLDKKDTIDLGTLSSEFYIGINLDKAIAEPGSKYDVVLRAGDIITVPEKNSTVKISGAVFYPNTTTYDPSYGWKDYVSQAGGFTKHAMRGRTYAIHMNGEVSTVAKGMRIEPGTEIVVPERDESERQPVSPAEIAAIATSATSIASLVATLVTLL